MKKKMQLTQREFDQFEDYLRHDEREGSTIEAYLRSLTRFAEWADGRSVTKELAMEWKTALSESGYRPISVNAMLAAVNKFFICMGREDCKVKYLKLQRQMFRKSEKDLSKEEYQRLVQAAHEKGDLRMELILETICATGIRVGELKYITLEAVRAGVAEIALKGKIRTILLPRRLCRKLQKYAKQQKIASGKIFLTQDGLSTIYLDPHEGPLRSGGRGAEQGVPPQPPQPVRPVLLRLLPRRGPAGGCTGAQQH